MKSFAAFLGLTLACCVAANAATVSPDVQNWEMQYGERQFAQYEQRGEILPPNSPFYAELNPIGNAIAAVADTQYFTPFRFYVLNQPEPNAFAMPGGNVYVTTGMLSFLRAKDQLAGVICHEVNHDIHHDLYAGYHNGGNGMGGGPSTGFEYAAETNADRAGAYTCAKAGFNPWGMIWNFRQYAAVMGGGHAASSDHPSDRKRVSDLLALFASDPQTFGRFKDDVAAAVPLQRQAMYSMQPQPPYPPPPLPPCYPGCK